MSHERLRYNVLLREQELVEDAPSKNNLDPIYSDVVYNTHFSIFVNAFGKIEDEKYKASKLKFYVQNYLGDVSIGITKVVGMTTQPIARAYAVDGFSSGRHIKLYVIMQGLCNTFDCVYPPKKDETLDFEFIEGDMLEVIPLFEPIDNSFSYLESDSTTRNESVKFNDSQYSKRDGEDIRLLDNFNTKKRKIDALKEVENPNDIEAILSDENGEQFGEGDMPGVFGGQGGGFFCKQKISDIYIRK